MKKLFIVATLVVALLGASDYTPLTPAEMQNYVNQINTALADQQARNDAYLQEISSGSYVMTAVEKGTYERMVTDLEAKSIIWGNLAGTEVVQRSSAVRDKILELMNDESLSPTDISTLQQVINAEKVKMQQVPVN